MDELDEPELNWKLDISARQSFNSLFILFLILLRRHLTSTFPLNVDTVALCPTFTYAQILFED